MYIKCNKCGNTKDIDTTLQTDEGYSNWTVLDSGFISFKCPKCGNFHTSDTAHPNYKEKCEFTISCPNCARTKWDYVIGDVDGEEENGTHIICVACKHVIAKSND